MAKPEITEEDQQLLDKIEALGNLLRGARDTEVQVREELYPLLFQANHGRRISLARLQAKTGLTRGRIHQIVNLMARKDEPKQEDKVEA